MVQSNVRGRILEVFLLTLSSLVLYHIGIGVGVFLIPLQVVATRRGFAALAAASGGFLLVFLALRFLPFLGGALRPDVMTAMEIAAVASLLLGLLIVNYRFAAGRALHRMLAATALVGCAAIPLGIWLSHSASFRDAMNAMFADVSRMLTSLFTGKEETADPAVSSLLSPEALRRISDAYVSRSLLATYFLLLSFSWWAGQLPRAASGGDRRFRFADFRLEGFWLWPFIAAGALVLIDLFLSVRGVAGGAGQATAGGLAWPAYAGWNVGLVLLILYGLQGLAILRFLFEKHGLPRFLWALLLIGLAALAASPRAGLFVILALPAFGISENWVRYRVIPGGESGEPRESP